MHYLSWIALALVVLTAALWRALKESRPRLRVSFGLLLVWLGIRTSQSVASFITPDLAAWHQAEIAVIRLAGLQVAVVVAFDFALRRFHLPRMAKDITVVLGYIGVLAALLISLGVNVTGVFATSAVATAVAGLALQDMLSNLASGISLQFEGVYRTGDFIQFGDQAGRVELLRLRSTVIRNSDNIRIIVPNRSLTGSAVLVYQNPSRIRVDFALPHRHHPRKVIETVEAALASAAIKGLKESPAAACHVIEITASQVTYGIYFWTDEPILRSAMRSAVLTRSYYALERSGIPLHGSPTVVVMGPPADGEPLEPGPVLLATPLFRGLRQDEIDAISKAMRRLDYGPGEQIIAQGDRGESMFFVAQGRVEIHYRSPDSESKLIAEIGPGEFFGEISLLAGAPRSAGAKAASYVSLWELSKAGIEGVLSHRPELAQDLSTVVAVRQAELSMQRDDLDRETALRRQAESQQDLLDKIRKFFSL